MVVFSSILIVKPSGAANVWPFTAAITLSVSVDLAFATACAHMWMPIGGFHRIVGQRFVGAWQLLGLGVGSPLLFERVV
jgi:hypothetical protein